MLQKLNLKIKFREGFRPFAPVVSEEDTKQYFDADIPSYYMLFTFPVAEKIRKPLQYSDSIEETASGDRSSVPAVTHVDYSARIQTVNKNSNSFLYEILKCYKEKTGCSVLINTSFNTNNEPIVNDAADAYCCFMRSEIDNAVIGNRLFYKSEQSDMNKKVKK